MEEEEETAVGGSAAMQAASGKGVVAKAAVASKAKNGVEEEWSR